MRKTFVCIALALLLALPAMAETLPVYHAKSTTQAPYETVEYREEPPFAADAPLLRVDVLGIRQGDCIVISCGGETLLVDGGEGWRYPYVKAYLEENSLQGFDYFILTHAHDDHLEMQEKLIKEGYSVGKVLSPYGDKDNYELWNTYRKLLDKKGIPYEKVGTGDTLSLGGAVLTFYRRDEKKITMNNHSLAAMLRFGGASMFLAADIGGETQRWLLKNFDPSEFKCDIYKSAHHNRTASVKEFLDALDPALAVNTNTRSSTETGDKQQGSRKIARYYISTGTVYLTTDGAQWYVYQRPISEE